VFIEELTKDQRFFFAVCITVIVSICLHELAHGVVAILFGDRTPIESGHMTLNPAAHVSPVSIVCLLLAGIAWGMMPVDPRRMRGRYAESFVALAGPAMNVLLAVLALASLGVWQRLDDRPTAELSTTLQNLTYFLWVFGFVNFHLAVFNLIPVPPLDGSRILGNISGSYARLMQTLSMTGGLIVIFIILFSFAGRVTAPLASKAAIAVLRAVRGS